MLVFCCVFGLGCVVAEIRLDFSGNRIVVVIGFVG